MVLLSTHKNCFGSEIRKFIFNYTLSYISKSVTGLLCQLQKFLNKPISGLKKKHFDKAGIKGTIILYL